MSFYIVDIVNILLGLFEYVIAGDIM